MTPTAHITLAPEHFYWAMLDVKGLPNRRRTDPKSLGFLFENSLPVTIENVQAVFVPIDSPDEAQVIACGISKDELRGVLQQEPDALTLGPTSLPPLVPAVGPEPDAINLLVGEFEPPRIKAMRRRAVVEALFLLAILTGLVIVGLEWRVSAANREATQAHSVRQELIREVVMLPAGSTQSPDLAVVAELRTLRQTRQQVPNQHGGAALRDVTPALASLLQHWPAGLHVQTESVSITPTSMTLRGLALTSDDVQRLADAFMPLEGWRMQQPEISNATKGVNATLQWSRGIDSPDAGRN